MANYYSISISDGECGSTFYFHSYKYLSQDEWNQLAREMLESAATDLAENGYIRNIDGEITRDKDCPIDWVEIIRLAMNQADKYQLEAVKPTWDYNIHEFGYDSCLTKIGFEKSDSIPPLSAETLLKLREYNHRIYNRPHQELSED